MSIYKLPITLNKISPSLLVGQLDEWQLLPDVEIYLEIKAQIPESGLIKLVRYFIKIASPDEIENVVSPEIPDIQVYSGVHLTQIERLPVGLEQRDGFKYFRLEKSGPYWKRIEESKELAVYLPEQLYNAILHMIGFRGNPQGLYFF